MPRPKKKIHKSSTSEEWKILLVTTHEAAQGSAFPLHCHTCWEWVYYRFGFAECVHGGKPLSMQPGTLWLTPPGIYHSEAGRTDYGNICLLVEGPPKAKIPKIIQETADGSIGRLCRSLLVDWREAHANRQAMIRLLTEALVLQIERWPEKNVTSKSSALVRNAEALWEDKPGLSVEEVARELGTSISVLRRSFHLERSQSPIQSRMCLRVRRATQLLHTSSLKLDAIAELCGFDSASHLSRQIKIATNIPPGQLRNQQKALTTILK